MGGKVKQANRTKNNVRPSSSGRSAELLSNKVNASLVLAGPGKLLPAVFPSLLGAQDQALGNDFLLCFKKFYKKDPITKIKALNELKDLVGKSEVDEVVEALPSWVHYYPTLTVDNDRKVREATQACHGAIVRKCGRKLARQIKRLLPAWLLAVHDDYGPAQCRAQLDLDATFPDDKLAEAITFCKVEIINLFLDNLKGNAEHMFSGKKLEDEEEQGTQMARVLGGSLRATALVARRLPAAHAPWLWDALLPLLCANTYWRLAAHPHPFVRSSWYILTGVLLERFGARLPPELGKRCARALLAHPEAAPQPGAERWRALLQFMHNVEDWLTYMGNVDLLIKRLLDMLDNAAWGEARRVAALLPALVARLPARARTADFYRDLFNAMLNGLSQKLVMGMKSERDQWCGMIADSVALVARAPPLASWVLRAWLERVLLAPASHARLPLIRFTATHMAQIVKQWLAHAREDQSFDQMVRTFWLNVGSTMLAQIDILPNEPVDIINDIDAHTQFLLTLKAAFDRDGKKRNITFEDEKVEDVEQLAELECDEDARKLFQHNLSDTAEMVIGRYFEFADANVAVSTVVPALMPLFREFRGAGLLRAVSERLRAGPAFGLYERALRPWLAAAGARCPALAEVVLALLQYVAEDQQDAVFDSFKELPPVVTEWVLSRVLAGAPGCAGAARRWLRSEVVGGAVVALCAREQDAEARRLLLHALAPDLDSNEMLLSGAAVEAVMAACSAQLAELLAPPRGRRAPGAGDQEGRKESAEARVLFCAEVARALPAARAPAALPLLLDLFRLTLHLPHGSAALAEGALQAALSAWRVGASRLPGPQRALFVRRALAHVHQHLFHQMDKLDVPRIAHAVSLCPPLAPARGPAPLLAAVAALVLDARPHPPPQPPLEVLALQLEVMWGSVATPFEDDNPLIAEALSDRAALTHGTLVAHAHVMLFRAMYMQALLVRKESPGEQGGGGELLRAAYFRLQASSVVRDAAAVAVLDEYYAFWPHYDIIHEVREHMESIVRDIVGNIPGDAREALRAGLAELSAAHGYYWARAYQYYKDITSADNESECKLIEHSEEKTEFYDTFEPLNQAGDIEELDTAFKEALAMNKEDASIDDTEKPNAELEELFTKYAKELQDLALTDKTEDTVKDWPESVYSDIEGFDFSERSGNGDGTERSESPECNTSSWVELQLDTAEKGAMSGSNEEDVTIGSNAEGSTSDSNIEGGMCATDVEGALRTNKDEGDNVQEDSRTSIVEGATCANDVEEASRASNVESVTNVEATSVESMMVLLERWREGGGRKKSYLGQASRPTAKVASACKDAAEYVALLGDMVLDNGYFHEAQLSAARVRSRRWRARRDFWRLRDARLEHFELTGTLVDEHDDDRTVYKELGLQPDEGAALAGAERAMARGYYCASARAAPRVDELVADAARAQLGCLDVVLNGYYRHNCTLLFDNNSLSSAPWALVSGTAAALDGMREAVRARGWGAPAAHWDFTNIALCSALATLAANARRWQTTKMAVLARAALELYCDVRRFIASVRGECERRAPSAHVAALPQEWDHIFAPEATACLYQLICHVLENSTATLTASEATVVESLIAAAKLLEPGAAAARELMLSRQCAPERAARAAAAALARPAHRGYKYLAYYALLGLTRALIEDDVATMKAKPCGAPGADDEEAVFPQLAFNLYDEPFAKLQELVDAALSTYEPFEDVCELVPLSDSHSLVLGYLLLSVVMHRHCELATGDLALHYVTVYNAQPYIAGLLPALLRLLPAAAAGYMACPAAAAPRALLPAFIRIEDFTLRTRGSGAEVSRLACGAALRALGGPGGAGARSWAAALPPRRARALERLVAAAVAPPLVSRQLADLKRRKSELGTKAEVSISASSREATCTLWAEGRALSVRATFAAAHPLHAPRVHSPAPGPDPRALAHYLANRNGRLIEVMKMWVQAVGAAKRGAAACYVCYCRVHPTDGSEPGYTCLQCRNCFHSQCLRRWLASSSRSQCPVCRTNF